MTKTEADDHERARADNQNVRRETTTTTGLPETTITTGLPETTNTTGGGRRRTRQAAGDDDHDYRNNT
jgi:hypothetical protein